MILLRTKTIIKIKLKIYFIKINSPIIIFSSMNNSNYVIYKKNWKYKLKEIDFILCSL